MAILTPNWKSWRNGPWRYFLALVFALLVPNSDSAPPRLRATESEIKSTYMYNFALFTTWPESAFAGPEEPLVVGVMGDHPFGNDLDKLVALKKAGARPMKLVRSSMGEPPPACHILFIATSEKPRLRELLKAVHGLPVLTVSDIEGFCSLGGCIRFTRGEKSLGLFFNPAAAKNQGLKLSPDLLAIGKIRESATNVEPK